MLVKTQNVSRHPSRFIRIGLTAAILVGVALPALAQTPDQTAAGVSFARQTAAQPQPLTVRDWVNRSEMLGDWGGARTSLAERGFTIETSWTQFFQWAPASENTRAWDYGGKLDFKMTQDLSKQGWDGVSATSHVEFRYGDVPLFAGGTLVPTTSALLFPENEGAKARISSFYVSKKFGENTLLEAGRFNSVDRYDHPFTGGQGVDKFGSLAFVMPPLYARTIPPVTEGVFFTALRDLEPFVTVGLFESTDDGFFKNGATFLASLSLPHHLFPTPGHVAVTTTAGSIVANSLDQDPYTLVPPFDAPLAQESNAFTVDFTFDQYLWWDPVEKEGFGLFGTVGVTDANPSPVDIFANFGIGGNSPIRGRSRDEFGAGYYFTGVSETLQDTLEPLIRLRSENGFEGYYNFAVTGWSKVTANVQFIDPFAVGSKTRAFFSLRWKLTF